MIYRNLFCDNISDDSVAIDGCGSPFRSDRDCDVTGLFVCCLFVLRPSNKRVYLRDGPAQTIVCAATLR